MINDLLDASRLEAHQLPLRAETVDVVELARDVVERMGGEISGRVRLQARGDIPSIRADRLRFEEVLVNLLSNAAKYGDPGTDIEVAIEANAGDVVVSVKNQGPGISAEEMPTLFRRFRRTSRAMKGETSGVGLGLYIAKGLVEAHGGRIWAESEPGRTTTFSFRLPGRLAEAA
jgi:signal transduction histidine kinase